MLSFPPPLKFSVKCGCVGVLCVIFWDLYVSLVYVKTYSSRGCWYITCLHLHFFLCRDRKAEWSVKFEISSRIQTVRYIPCLSWGVEVLMIQPTAVRKKKRVAWQSFLTLSSLRVCLWCVQHVRLCIVVSHVKSVWCRRSHIRYSIEQFSIILVYSCYQILYHTQEIWCLVTCFT